MIAADIVAIERLALAKNYHGPERADAVAAYERGLRAGELHKSAHMDFMSEIVAPIPDLLLRAMCRKKVIWVALGSEPS